MESKRQDKAVNRVAVGLVVGCLAVVLVTVAALAIPAIRTRLGLGPLLPPTYPVGAVIDVPPDIYRYRPVDRDFCAL